MFEPSTGKILAEIAPWERSATGQLFSTGANETQLFHLAVQSDATRTLYSVEQSGVSKKLVSGLLSLDSGGSAGWASEQGDYYFSEHTGIHRIAKDSTQAELIIDSADFALASKEMFYANGDFSRMDDGAFYVVMKDGLESNQNALYRYQAAA